MARDLSAGEKHRPVTADNQRRTDWQRRLRRAERHHGSQRRETDTPAGQMPGERNRRRADNGDKKQSGKYPRAHRPRRASEKNAAANQAFPIKSAFAIHAWHSTTSIAGSRRTTLGPSSRWRSPSQTFNNSPMREAASAAAT